MTRDGTIALALRGKLGAFGIDVAMDVPAHGVTALFGPSGCGKTTVLRCIAGLEHIPGRITIDGEIWQDSAAGIFRPPHLRRVGYVFQEASLFPHLAVRDNLLYGARRVRGGAAQNGSGFDGIVDLLGIGGLLARDPATLSGGERQRVAIGRALLTEPRVLLMDEPLSALDRATKLEILPYLEALHERLDVPIVYVSHDLAETERLADTLALMRDGRVIACGPLTALQTDPRLPLLSAPEASVVLEGRVAGLDAAYALTELDVPGGRLVVPGRHGALGDRRRLRITASDVSLARSAPADSTILNCLPARIVAIETDGEGAQASVILALGREGTGSRIAARITRRSLSVLGLKPGEDVYAQIKSVALAPSLTDRRTV